MQASSPSPPLPQPQSHPPSKGRDRRRNKGQERVHELVSGAPTNSISLPFREQPSMQRIEDMAWSFGGVSIAPGAPASTAQLQQITSALQQQFPTTTLPYPPMGYPPPASQRPTRPKKVGGRDEKTLPSKESGGVPNPSPQYILAASMLSQPAAAPRDLLVVIDLNGTLLYRPNRSAPKKFTMRPHAQLFLKYCVDTFVVVIWSSARPQNVTAMCDTILSPDLRSKVAAIWGRDRFRLTKEDYNLRVQCYKRLEILWGDSQIAAAHPAHNLGGRWDQTNTVLIDDSLEKARSEPFNIIEVPEWLGDQNEADNILPQVHDHLNHLSLQSNVSACMRASPFKPRVGGGPR